MKKELYILVSQLVINRRICSQSRLNIDLVFIIQVNLENLWSIDLTTSPLSFNVSWVNNIPQYSFLDSCKSPTTWSQSFSLLITSIWFTKDAPLSNEDNMTSWELLLQFTNNTMLDRLEGLVLFEWYVDNNSLASGTTVNFFSSSNVQWT